MNIKLKTLVIFGLLIALSTQESTTSNSTENTLASTSAAAATTTQAPASTGNFTTGITSNSTENTPATTAAAATTTQDPTSTGNFTTDTTSNSTDSTTAITTAATTTMSTTQGPCVPNPCVGDSTCVERFEGTFACTCRPGLVYLERGCTLAKVFPGSLSFNKTFQEDMANGASKLFQEEAYQIEKALRNILGSRIQDQVGYINSTVLSLSNGSIIADVQNFYDLDSDATSETVANLIADGMKTQIDEYQAFNKISLCDSNTCDQSTTNCEGDGTISCTCKEGYISSGFTSTSCISCPNGEKAVDKKCEKCSFGFSGFNCNDPYLLVVVVVSTVLGALLIIFIVALIVVSCRDQKDSSSDKVDFSSNYGNTELHKPTGVPRIPRANPDASWKSNNLEMTNSGSNQALVTRDRPESKGQYSDYEDVSYRGQVPPAYSGHGGRGVENGVQNPYFRQDDDRTRRY
ncbi:hypothetical protein R3I94_019852 [Phoxinus phoxinus]